MFEKNSRFVVLLVCLLQLSALRLWAAAPLFSDSEKKELDDTAGEMEKDNDSGKPQGSDQLLRFMSSKSMGLVVELYLDSSPRASAMDSKQRQHYRDNPKEFLGDVLKSELGKQRLDRFERIFEARLSAKDRAVRKKAIEWLATFGAGSDAADALRRVLSSADADDRLEAASQLAALKDKSGEKVLIDELTSQSAYRSWKAATGLVKLGNGKGKTRLFEIIHTTDSRVDPLTKANAIDSLAAINEPDVEQEIDAQLANPAPIIVNSAVGALQTRVEKPLSESRAKRLFEILDDPNFDQGTKYLAFSILSANPKSEWHDRFLAFKNSPDPNLRAGMIRSLMQIGEKRDVGFIEDYLDDNSRPVRQQAEYALRRLTGMSFGSIEQDLDQVIQKRKDWWKQHKGDSDYK